MYYIEYKTEAELCAAFIKANAELWDAYQETASFDILMVRKEDGFQIGIEAKLKLNAKVISQIAEQPMYSYVDLPGPDCRAILVPMQCRGSSLSPLVPLLHVTGIYFGEYESYGSISHQQYPYLPRLDFQHPFANTEWFELAPAKNCSLPDYMPDVQAGKPSPVMLTDWKVRAIKIALLIEKRGFVTRKDFKKLEINITIWTQSGWIVLDQNRKVWVAGKVPDFRSKHPVNFGQIEADYENWSKEVLD